MVFVVFMSYQAYKEVIESPEAKHWEFSKTFLKLNFIKENNTFTFTKLSESRQAVEGGGGGGSPSITKTFKSRYVAKGYSQL